MRDGTPLRVGAMAAFALGSVFWASAADAQADRVGNVCAVHVEVSGEVGGRKAVLDTVGAADGCELVGVETKMVSVENGLASKTELTVALAPGSRVTGLRVRLSRDLFGRLQKLGSTEVQVVESLGLTFAKIELKYQHQEPGTGKPDKVSYDLSAEVETEDDDDGT